LTVAPDRAAPDSAPPESPARRAVAHGPAPFGPVVLGLDLGATQVRAAAILPTGERLGRRAVTTPRESGAEAIYRACADLLNGIVADLPDSVRRRLMAIGISSMGPVDPRRGLVVDPPNVPALHDAPLAAEMSARVGLPAYLERDTNVAALAEHSFGAARDCSNFLYITVSSGLGGAIFHDGRLFLGPDGTAGELGHVALIPSAGPLCGCGGVGHLEGIASGSGLARQGQDEVAAGRSAFLAERAATAALTGKDVAEGEVAGDQACIALMERARDAFAIACVGWVNAFNPELIVVGGTVAERQGPRWLETARTAVQSTALVPAAKRCRILPAELGADVGLAGAWPLVMDRHTTAPTRDARRRG
jgi:glucokinase